MPVFLIITGVGFLFLLISALAGGDHEVGGHEFHLEHDHDAGHDHEASEGGGSPSPFSMRIIAIRGPQVLVAASYIEKFEWAGRHWVKYLRDNHNLRRIICIAHENCGWYRNITVGGLTIPLLKDRQISDLKKTRLVLHDMFPKTESEAWYAAVDKNHVQFIKIA